MNGSAGRDGAHEDVVVRKAEHGWEVRGENVPDLTSAMVLADLFAADQAADDDTRLLEAVDENGHPRQPSGRGPAPQGPGHDSRQNPGQHGPAQHRQGQQVPSNAPGQPRQGQHGPGQNGPGQNGPGQNRHGQNNPGQDGPGQGGPGQNRQGQQGSSQHAPGQNGPGQQNPGQQNPGQHSSGQHGAGQQGSRRPPAPRPPSERSNAASGQSARSVRDNDEAARLAVTVAQLEHALASRVRVEQAIGVLAERHRLRPREAFDLLRGAARSRGRRITEMAQDVVASAANPLLRLPDELSRKLPEPRQRGRSLRRARHAEQY